MNQKKRNKLVLDPSEVLSFVYETKHSHQETTKPRPKSNKQVSRHHVSSKSEFILANFRFVVSPLSNPFEECWFDPNIPVPWECIECVIAPLPQSEESLCPICLDEFKIAKVTKCGHFYCLLCLIRHLKCDRHTRFKCPICNEHIHLDDVKSVRFESLYAIDLIPESKSPIKISTQQVLSNHNIEVNDILLCQHLTLPMGSLFPSILPFPTSSPSSSLPINQIAQPPLKKTSNETFSALYQTKISLRKNIDELSTTLPLENTRRAKFSRIMYRDLPHVSEAYQLESKELQQLQQVLSEFQQNPANKQLEYDFQMDIDLEMLSFIQDALTFVEKQRHRFEQQLYQRFIVEDDSQFFHSIPQEIINEREEKEQNSFLLRFDKLSLNNNNIKHNNNHNNKTSLPHDDVETNQKKPCNSQKTNSEDLSTAIDCETISKPRADSQSTLNSEGENSRLIEEDEDVSLLSSPILSTNSSNQLQFHHMYQGNKGSMIFLHPLCVRCIVEQIQFNFQQFMKYYQEKTLINQFPKELLGWKDLTIDYFFPRTLQGKVVEIESFKIPSKQATKDNKHPRNKAYMQYLKHLPAHTEVKLVELDMKSLNLPISSIILKQFEKEFQKRKQMRKNKIFKEKALQRLEKDQKLAEKLAKEEYNLIKNIEFISLKSSESLGCETQIASEQPPSLAPPSTEVLNSNAISQSQTIPPPPPASIIAAANDSNSFPTLTKQSAGHFPNLAPSSTVPTSNSISSKVSTPNTQTKSTGKSVWGQQLPNKPSSSNPTTPTPEPTEESNQQPIAPSSSGKYSKKSKVSLFSTVSSRTYR